MKLFLIVGRVNGQLGFAHKNFDRSMVTGPAVGCSNGQWDILAFADVNKAMELHDELRHGTAKLCKVIEVEIPDDL